MDQFLTSDFNQTTSITVGLGIDEGKRIKNLVANLRFAKVIDNANNEFSVVFSSIRNNKPPVTMTYVINSKYLTNQQISILTQASFVPEVTS